MFCNLHGLFSVMTVVLYNWIKTLVSNFSPVTVLPRHINSGIGDRAIKITWGINSTGRTILTIFGRVLARVGQFLNYQLLFFTIQNIQVENSSGKNVIIT